MQQSVSSVVPSVKALFTSPSLCIKEKTCPRSSRRCKHCSLPCHCASKTKHILSRLVGASIVHFPVTVHQRENMPSVVSSLQALFTSPSLCIKEKTCPRSSRRCKHCSLLCHCASKTAYPRSSRRCKHCSLPRHCASKTKHILSRLVTASIVHFPDTVHQRENMPSVVSSVQALFTSPSLCIKDKAYPQSSRRCKHCSLPRHCASKTKHILSRLVGASIVHFPVAVHQRQSISSVISSLQALFTSLSLCIKDKAYPRSSRRCKHCSVPCHCASKTKHILSRLVGASIVHFPVTVHQRQSISSVV